MDDFDVELDLELRPRLFEARPDCAIPLENFVKEFIHSIAVRMQGLSSSSLININNSLAEMTVSMQQGRSDKVAQLASIIRNEVQR